MSWICVYYTMWDWLRVEYIVESENGIDVFMMYGMLRGLLLVFNSIKILKTIATKIAGSFVSK